METNGCLKFYWLQTIRARMRSLPSLAEAQIYKKNFGPPEITQLEIQASGYGKAYRIFRKTLSLAQNCFVSIDHLHFWHQ